MRRAIFALLALVALALVFISVTAGYAGEAPTDFAGMEVSHAPVVHSYDPAAFAAFKRIVAPYLERGTDIPESIFEADYASDTPQLMIDALNADPTCHVAAHNLGRVIYRHTRDLVSSLAICGTKCAEGCVHGVLLELFHAPSNDADPSPASLTPALKREIAATCRSTEITRFIGVANCFHAIGHVLAALANNDVSQAIGLCDAIYSTDAARYFCATGVYMQREVELGPGALRSGRVEPCAGNGYPAACYRFQLFGIFNGAHGYAEASAYCATLVGSQRLGCFNGVGADWYRLLVIDPGGLDALCGTGDADDQRMCLEGALELLRVYYPASADHACLGYTAGSVSDCKEAAAHQNFDLSRDLSRYVE